jgi:dipeptidyl aminopeptidase/acylaminoacyl peptidase
MKNERSSATRWRRWLRRAAWYGGFAAAGYTLLGAGLAWAFLHPARVRGHGSPADVGLEFEPVRLTSTDGVRLVAWYVPCRGARAGIVLCHGYRACRQYMVDLLPFLHRAGFAVLAFDFRGMGESGGSKCSFGHTEKEDVKTAVRSLEERARIPARHIGVFGHSMGGAAAIMAAAEDPEIGAVVSDSGFARLDQMIAQRFRRLGLGGAGRSLSICTRWWAERMCGFAAGDVAPAVVAARIAPRPLLIIHGEQDTYTPPAQARALFAAAREPKELWIVPHASHVACHEAAKEEYERRVAAFFRRALMDER